MLRTEFESVIKAFPTVVSLITHGSLLNSTKYCKILPQLPTRCFQTIEKEAVLPESFYETNITLIPKTNRDAIGKEYYRLICLIRDAKVLKKVLANRIQQHIRQIIHPD